MTQTIKMKMKLLLLALAALAAINSYGQNRGVAYVDTLATLDAMRPQPGMTVYVRGGTVTNDWGDTPLPFSYVSGSTNTITRFCRATATGVGRWMHDWDGDVRAFGVSIEDVLSATNNGVALAAATAYARTTGGRLILPSGRIYSDRPIDATGLAGVIGQGTISDSTETTLVITTPNTSAITNLSLGGVVSDMYIRSLYYSWAKTATNGWGVHGVNGTAIQQVKNLYIQGFFGGIYLGGFDSTVSDVDVIAKRPLVVGGGGTQNTIIRSAFRGNIFVTPTENDTSITCAAYTAGSTNFVVSDASNIAIGDYIRPRVTTEYPVTITHRFFPRKVTNVSGNTVTVNYPWPFDFTNGLFEFVLGKGYSAIESLTESVLVGINCEWGSWDHIYTPNSGPTASSTITGMHVEGWTVDPGTGANSFVLNGVNTSISASHIDMANITVFDTLGVALAQGGTRGKVDIVHLRDFDQYQSVPFFYPGAWDLTRTYSGALVVGDVNNAGADIIQRTVDGTQWRNTVSDFKFGESGELVRVDGIGVGRAYWYGFTALPTGGNFVQGDIVLTENERLRALTTGSFQTAAGSNRMFNGSSILLVDQTARGVLGRRTPVAFAVTNGVTVSTNHLIVREQLRNSPDTNALVANAASGARMIQVADASGVQQGDPGIIVEGSTFNDVSVARVVSPYIFFTRPLTNSFTTAATFFTGIQMFSASTNDVHWQALKFSAPTFITEIDYLNRQRVGEQSVQTALTVVGGASGIPIMQLERPGSGTNSFLTAGNQFRIRNNANSRQMFSALDGTTDYYLVAGDSSAVATPIRGIVQSEYASGSNVGGAPLVIRAGSGTGGAPLTNKVSISIPIATNATATALQSAADVATFQVPTSPGTNQSIFKLYFWTGSAWAERGVWSTNIGGVNYLIHP